MTTYLEGENIKLLPWQADVYEGHHAIDSSARYFTLRRFVPMEAGQPFEMGVDPLGILSRMRGNDLIHGMDNKVDYLREEKEKNGKAK